MFIAPFGDAYEKIGTIQKNDDDAWPLHKDDTLFQSGRPTGLNIYFSLSTVEENQPFLVEDVTYFPLYVLKLS
ncbi:hypothetical protein F5888DRAFT_1620888 [Russula emetica]|nr:hypothetical protein F5888DRAFT_1620888 [Russula emetica]